MGGRANAEQIDKGGKAPPALSKLPSSTLPVVAAGVACIAVAAALVSHGSVAALWLSTAVSQSTMNAKPGQGMGGSARAREATESTQSNPATTAADLLVQARTAEPTSSAATAKAPVPGCEDKNESCELWASMGECANNPGYMVRNCAVACGTCGQAFEPSCDADGPNAVKEGDISSMFERAATLAHFKPRVLSRDPWVLVFDAFLTPHEAAEVRRIGGHDFQRSLAGDGVTAVRTSSTSWCNVPVCEREPLIKEVKARALDVLRMPEGNSEHLQTLRYEPGQFYKRHHDQNADPQSAWGPRIYTFFFYLSDVEEGGGTFFPNLNITVEPRVGRALIWPSVYDSNILRSDMRTEHEALPVVRGEKYASNLWLHLREFQKPLLNGCENRAVKRRIT